jgi:hypothetical protein
MTDALRDFTTAWAKAATGIDTFVAALAAIGVSTAHLVGAHVYAVERIDRTTNPPTIVLINPWGAQGSKPDQPYETRITEEQWNANFITYSHTPVRP